MIVVDTFQRNFGGGNENSAEDVGNFIHQLDGLIAMYGCNVCIVHAFAQGRKLHPATSMPE